ncbi:hypothetical protein CR513_05393, partial [Mucuna pruriens]
MSLPPRSIRTFDELAGLFLSQFATNKTKRLEVADLFDIRQTRGRARKVTWRTSMTPPFEWMIQIKKANEYGGNPCEGRETCGDGRRKVRVKGGAHPFRQLTKAFKGSSCTDERSSSPQQRADPKASGHSTEDCWTLGAQLESLIQQGRLGQYVARTGREKTRSPRPAPTFYRGTISTISGGEISYGDQDDRMRRNVCQSYEAQDVLTGANLTPLWKRRKEPSITFQDTDMRWRTVSRDEPMVIFVVAADCKIERVLIDQGSSANILYGSTYRKMGLFGLKETPGCLYGFLGERVPIRGTIELDTVFGEGSSTRIIPVLYTVVKAKVSYNIIMGQPTLNRLKAIVSTYHLCMKYPVGGGVGRVWADSHMARKCYEDSLRVGQRVSTVNALSLELDPRGQNEREKPYPVEELKEVWVGPKEIQKTKIGTVMSKE